jgi:hypothetical protein
MRRFFFVLLLVGSFWLLGSSLAQAQVSHPLLQQMGLGSMRIVGDDEVPRNYGPVYYPHGHHHGYYVYGGPYPPPYVYRRGGMTPSQAQWIRSTITRQSRW